MTDARPTVYIFYDYVCPYVYLGWHRLSDLADEHDLELRWLPWEIYPTTEPQGEEVHGGSPEASADWLDRLADEIGVELNGPEIGVNSNLALRGAEYAKDQGGDVFEAFHELVFEAVWQDGRNIGDPMVVTDLAVEAGMDRQTFSGTLPHNAYQARLDAVDRAARRLGIQRVPTVVFGDQRIVANDPYGRSLDAPLEAFLERWEALGPELATTLAHDTDLERVLIE